MWAWHLFAIITSFNTEQLNSHTGTERRHLFLKSTGRKWCLYRFDFYKTLKYCATFSMTMEDAFWYKCPCMLFACDKDELWWSEVFWFKLYKACLSLPKGTQYKFVFLILCLVHGNHILQNSLKDNNDEVILQNVTIFH